MCSFQAKIQVILTIVTEVEEKGLIHGCSRMRDCC